MSKKKPTYEELEARLAGAEEIVRALRGSEVDAVIGEKAAYVIRLMEAEEALKKSEENYGIMLHAIPDAVTTTDLEGRITFAGLPALTLHGYGSEDEVLGKSAFDLIVEEDRDRARANFEQALGGVTIRNVEYTMLRKDGTRFLGERSAAMVRDSSWKPKGCIAVTRDITERRRIESDLRERMEELELFTKVAVGREERMAGMKEKMEALEKELEKYKAGK